MKRLFLLLCLLCLLPAACARQDGPTLAGTWVNAGQYSEGRDFVETLTLKEDGTAAVHLDYQGQSYATLEGRWSVEGDTLSVDFTDPNTRDRSYTYTLTEEALILTGDGKDVTYQRQD